MPTAIMFSAPRRRTDLLGVEIRLHFDSRLHASTDSRIRDAEGRRVPS